MTAKLSALTQQLGYEFTDKSLLKAALTHRSVKGKNNERLEFLGDSIVNFIVAEALYKRYPDAREGELSRLRSLLVKGDSLAELARELDLGSYLFLGSGELKSGGRERNSILADATEALIAALYLDGGLAICQQKVLSWYGDRLDNMTQHDDIKDPKTRLQEYLQARGKGLPSYDIVTIEGQAHEQIFIIECKVPDFAPSTQGRGTSRRRAEQQAAKLMITQLNI